MFENKILWNASGYVSQKTYQKLQSLSRKFKVPMTTLINRAIVNELKCDNAFERNMDISHIPYVDENTEDSQKLFSFIAKNSGLGKEHYLILREDIGIESDEAFLIAFRQLMQISMIVAIRPRNKKFDFADDYFVYYINGKAKFEKDAVKYRPIKGPLNEVIE